MTTKKKVEEIKNRTELSNCKEFLSSMQKFPQLEDYKTLGYALKSLCNIAKSAIILAIEKPKLIEHEPFDIYNVLSLISCLVPEDEMELLDLLNEL